MEPTPSKAADAVASAGLVVGGAFGLAGTFVSDVHVRQVLWMIDGVALVVAATLLCVRFMRRGHDVVAAGFLVFAIGQALIVSTSAVDLAESVPMFTAGICLWAAALAVIGAPAVFPGWVRGVGFVAASLFVVSAGMILVGVDLLPTSVPLPQAAYPFLVLTFVGWIWSLYSGRVD